MYLSPQKTYRCNELGAKTHYLAVCDIHPYPTSGGLMKFEITHSDVPYILETASNIRIDPENL